MGDVDTIDVVSVSSVSPSPIPSLQSSPSQELDYLRLDAKKLRQENAVLRKTVVQLNTDTENKKMQLEQITEMHKKAAEDADYLRDEVDRLTRRVAAMQKNDETGSPGSGWFSAKKKKGTEEVAVLKEELEAKIEENEIVHMQMFELKRKMQSEQEEWLLHRKRLEEGLKLTEQQLKETLDRYASEKATLEASISDLIREKNNLEHSFEELKDKSSDYACKTKVAIECTPKSHLIRLIISVNIIYCRAQGCIE